MDIVELARTTYIKTEASRAEGAEEGAEKWQAEFLTYARKSAETNLCAEAADLDWRYTQASDLPEGTEEARALLADGRLEYLRYRMDSEDEAAPAISFDLVQPCLPCGNDRVSPVTSLFQLGQLLNDDEAARAVEPQNATGQGPLLDIAAMENACRRLSGLTRRLVAQYGADITVDTARLYAHEGSGVTAELHLQGAGVAEADLIAAGLGIALTVEVSSATRAYVFRRAQGVGTVDGIEVRVSGYTQLSADESEAWLAENPPAPVEETASA